MAKAEVMFKSRTGSVTETALGLTALTLGLKLPTERRQHSFSNDVAYAGSPATGSTVPAADGSISRQNSASDSLFLHYQGPRLRRKLLLIFVGGSLALIILASIVAGIAVKLSRSPTTKVYYTTSEMTSLRATAASTTAVTGHLEFRSIGDDMHWVYADGFEVGHSDKYSEILTSIVPLSTRVIAVKVINRSWIGGLLGSLDNGKVITDNSWICTRQWQINWAHVDCDDSKWPVTTVEVQDYDSGLPHKTLWIWSGKRYLQTNESIVTTYCRKTLSLKSL